VEIKGKTAILIDDGIATGATVRAAVRAVRTAEAKQIVVATPVASPEAVAMLKSEADEVICLEEPEWLGAIGRFYRDFRQLSDADVVTLLDAAKQASVTATS
jgi:putative phosphoribosyl transferase